MSHDKEIYRQLEQEYRENEELLRLRRIAYEREKRIKFLADCGVSL